MRRVEDITEALWGNRVSSGTVSRLNQKIYRHIEAWSSRKIEEEFPYLFLVWCSSAARPAKCAMSRCWWQSAWAPRQEEPKFPKVWESKIPDPVHASASSVRTRPPRASAGHLRVLSMTSEALLRYPDGGGHDGQRSGMEVILRYPKSVLKRCLAFP